MELQEYQQLQAERGTLDSLLKRLPSSRLIERIGLESSQDRCGAGKLP